jgi:hypothetical protein
MLATGINMATNKQTSGSFLEGYERMSECLVRRDVVGNASKQAMLGTVVGGAIGNVPGMFTGAAVGYIAYAIPMGLVCAYEAANPSQPISPAPTPRVIAPPLQASR